MLYYELQLYKDLTEFSKILNKRIKQLEIYYRRDSGDEMRKLLRELKFNIYTINSLPVQERKSSMDTLVRNLVKMKILIDDTVDNGGFKLTGRGNVVECIKQLSNITEQAVKWRNSTGR